MRVKTRYIDGDLYTSCPTMELLEQEIKGCGFASLQEFEEATGVKPETLIGVWWILVHGRLFTLEDS